MPFQELSPCNSLSYSDLCFEVSFEFADVACFWVEYTVFLTFFAGCCRTITVAALRFPNFLGEACSTSS